jgi:hypothetical protein
MTRTRTGSSNHGCTSDPWRGSPRSAETADRRSPGDQEPCDRVGGSGGRPATAREWLAGASHGRWTRVGSEGTATFLHLLGKGVLTLPHREQLHAISPVALVMQPPSTRFTP